MSVPVSVLNLLLIAGALLITVALLRRDRRCQEPGCREKAIGVREGTYLCDRHYHSFRGKYPSAGEG